MIEAILIVFTLAVWWSGATLAVVLAGHKRWRMVFTLVHLAGALVVSVHAVAEIA